MTTIPDGLRRAGNKRELFVVAMSMSLMLYTRKAVESLQQRVTEVLWIGVC